MKALVLATLLSFSAQLNPAIAQDSPNELRVGQVIGNELGQVINGWRDRGGSLYQKRTWSNHIVTEVKTCCISIFERDGEILYAVAEPIARNDNGGVQAERITQIWKFTPEKDEVDVNCSMLWIDPLGSFSRGPGQEIRSVVYNGTTFVVVRWFDPGSYCDYGD